MEICPAKTSVRDQSPLQVSTKNTDYFVQFTEV